MVNNPVIFETMNKATYIHDNFIRALEKIAKSIAVYLFGRSELKETTIREVLESLPINLNIIVTGTLDIC